VTQPPQCICAIQGGSIGVANVENGEGCAVRIELSGHSDR
jgi:hypothetical protein